MRYCAMEVEVRKRRKARGQRASFEVEVRRMTWRGDVDRPVGLLTFASQPKPHHQIRFIKTPLSPSLSSFTAPLRQATVIPQSLSDGVFFSPSGTLSCHPHSPRLYSSSRQITSTTGPAQLGPPPGSHLHHPARFSMARCDRIRSVCLATPTFPPYLLR